MDWVGGFAIWFWLNANAVFNFYSQFSVFYKRLFCPTCPLILFTSIRRAKVGQKGLIGQSPVFRQVFLPSWFCTVRGVMWDRWNPPFITVTTSSFQAKVANSSCSPFQWPGHDDPNSQAAPRTPLRNLLEKAKQLAYIYPFILKASYLQILHPYMKLFKVWGRSQKADL